MKYVASISYGKDSLAMLHVITEVLKQPLDRIITAEVWATDDIQADLPPMVEFKDAADEIIEKRWGIKVERFCALEEDGRKRTYEKCFYKRHTKSNKDYKIGNIYGFPYLRGAWCNGLLKMDAVKRANSTKGEKDVSYIGIAADESVRVERHRKRDGVVLPLVEAGWTEQMCFDWCKENKLLSPLYATANRGGCWFCHNQGNEQLRLLRKNYPELWTLLLKWDDDAPWYAKFKPGRTVHDYEKRFQLEDEGYFDFGCAFKWDCLKATQMNLHQFIKGV